PTWMSVVAAVDAIVRKMPLWKLQTVGGQQIEFLYPNLGHGTSVELYPGVTAAFRVFHELIVELIRGAWLRYVRQYNTSAVGEANELGEFLFGSGLTGLQTYN